MSEIDPEEIERWIQVATETLNKEVRPRTSALFNACLSECDETLIQNIDFLPHSVRASVNGPIASTRAGVPHSNAHAHISVSASTPALPVSAIRHAAGAAAATAAQPLPAPNSAAEREAVMARLLQQVRKHVKCEFVQCYCTF